MNILNKITAFFFLSLTITHTALSQVPTHLDVDTEPVRFYEWPNILVFIILPVLLVIYFLWWRQNKRKQRQKLKDDLDNETKTPLK